MTNTSVLLVVLIPAIVWRIYSRARRLVGRQKSRLRRHWVAAIFFPLALFLVGFVAWKNVATVAGLAGGAAAGVALALWGLRLTRFESTPQGLFYTPNAYMGITLSLVIICRVLWRLFRSYDASRAVPQTAMQAIGGSPLTVLIFGMLAGYYTAYSIGMLRVRSAQRHQPAPGTHEPSPLS